MPDKVVSTTNPVRSVSEAATQGTRNKLNTVFIYEKVKHMAATYELKPGERINEIELSKKLNVSRTPLREVLNQLMVEGFLERTINKGFVARPLDVKQIFDLYEYRLGIETQIARLACARASDKDLADLEESVARDAAVPEDSSLVELLAIDEGFHMALARLTENQEYIKALANVNARIQYVRWIDMRRGRRPHTQAEHRNIVAAIRARDESSLIELLSQHISRRKDQITEVVKLGFAEIYTREAFAANER